MENKELTAVSILMECFIPYVCSEAYFKHCLERNGEWCSNVSQSLIAMQKYADQQTKSLHDELLLYKELAKSMNIRINKIK